jgi:hypothetical protein
LTSAPGITAPDESTTVPERLEKKVPCPQAIVPAMTIRAVKRDTTINLVTLDFMRSPPG